MQRFLKSYTPFLIALLLGSSVWATEIDRYGHTYASPLKGGEWWREGAILAPEETHAHIGKLVLVKGRVLSTFETREDRYLNFGEDYKTDFTVRIPKRAWKQFGDLKGREITVRGMVREYNGPMIVTDFGEQIHAN